MYFTKKDHSSFKLEGSCNPFTPFCEYFLSNRNEIMWSNRLFM